jgi:O-antigen ligase
MKMKLPAVSEGAVARTLRGAVIVLGAAGLLVLPQFTTNASFDGVAGLPGPVWVLALGLAFWLMPMLLVASWIAEGCARLIHPWLALPVALFVLGAAVSTALAADKSSALVRAAEMTGLWAGAWALVESLRSDGERRFLLAVLVAAAVGAAAVGIHQQAWGLPEAWQYFLDHRAEVLAKQSIVPGSYAENAFIGRFTGGVQAGLGHPNVLAAFLVLGLFAAAGLVREKWAEAGTKGARGLAVVLALAAATCAAGLALTQSRGGIIAALVGLWWLGAAWWVRRRGVRIALYLLPLAAGAAALAVAAAVDGPAVESVLLSLRYRLDYWQATAEVLRRHWLAGVGLENFGLYYTEFKLPTAPEEVRDPHNLVLSMWSNLGLAGLAALAGLVAAAVRSWRRAPEIASVLQAGAAASGEVPAAGASLLGFLVPTIVIAGPLVFFFQKGLTGWLAAAVIGGPMMVLMGLGSAEEPSRLAVSGRPLRSLGAACVAGLAAFALMEQIGMSILEPPTAWALLVVLGVSLRPPAAQPWVLSLGSEDLELAAAPEPGVRLGLWAKFALMLLAMAAGFAYTRVLLTPFMRAGALLAEAALQGDAPAQEPALEAAAAASPLSWEPALFRARAWQQQAAAEPPQERSLSLEHALAAYQDALARQPRLRQAYLGLAACRLMMPGALEGDRGAWQAALGYVEDASRLYPTDLPTQAQKATLLDRLGDDALALAEYRRLLDLDRRMPDVDRRLRPDFRAAVEQRIRQLEAATAPGAVPRTEPEE